MRAWLPISPPLKLGHATSGKRAVRAEGRAGRAPTVHQEVNHDVNPIGHRAGQAGAPEKPVRRRPAPQGDLLPVLPLRDIVVFPHMIVPLFVGREKSVRALEAVMKDDKQILLVAQKNAAQDDPSADDIYRVGTVSTILQLLKLPDGTVKVLVEGGRRAEHHRLQGDRGVFRGHRRADARRGGEAKELEALGRTVVTQFEQYIKLNKKIAPEVLVSLNQIEEPAKLADTVASHLNLKIAEKQELLEIAKVSERLERVFGHMESEIGVLQVEKRIRNRVKRQMEKTQREYYLNEQLKAIQKELGEGEDGKDETAELEAKIKKTKLSKEAREKAMAELKKLRTMSPMSAEATVVRNYLDWMLSIPWKKRSKIKQRRRRGREGAGRRPLRPGEGQGAHHRIPGGAGAHAQGARPDPVPGRPARRRQDLARQVDRARHRAATSCACRSAACATRRKSAATGAPISARCPARSSRA